MTMKLWRFFPILVKEEVLKNMDLSDKISFAKCSKKSRALLSRIPHHLKTVKIINDRQISNEDLLTMLTSQKSTMEILKVNITTELEKNHVEGFFENLSKIRTSLKVKELAMEISPEYSEMYKKIIDFSDPSFIEYISIEERNSQEIYKEILETPQWKNSPDVALNWYVLGSVRTNLDDFPHSVNLGVEELSVEDAWKIMQKVRNGSEDEYFWIKSQKPVQIMLIQQKIETELIGDWKNKGYHNFRFVTHPEKPHLILEYGMEWNIFIIAVKHLDRLYVVD